MAKSSRSSSWATVVVRARREQLRHRHVEPLAVEAHLEPLGVQHLARLLLEGARVGIDLGIGSSTGRVLERPLGSPTRAV